MLQKTQDINYTRYTCLQNREYIVFVIQRLSRVGKPTKLVKLYCTTYE